MQLYVETLEKIWNFKLAGMSEQRLHDFQDQVMQKVENEKINNKSIQGRCYNKHV